MTKYAAGNGRWAVAITTAPRRDCTLRRCVESVRACGWEPIIFAEPGATETDCFTVQNENRRGVWHNWLHSMRWTLENTDAEWILSVQDDSLFHPDSRTFTESILWPDPLAGFVSLYTPKHYTIRSADKSLRPAGVNRIHTWSLWGACALVFDRRILQRVVDSATARNWTGAPPRSRSKAVIQKRRDNPEIIANSDTAIGKVMNRMGRKMYFIDPSPVTHIAKHSTIRHGDNTGRRNAYRAADHAVPLADQVPAPEKRCELQV